MHLNHSKSSEYENGHFKEPNKSKAAKAKVIQSLERQLQYEQVIGVTRQIMETKANRKA